MSIPHDLDICATCGHPYAIHAEGTGECCYATCRCRWFIPSEEDPSVEELLDQYTWEDQLAREQ